MCGFRLDRRVDSFSGESTGLANSPWLIWVMVGCAGNLDLGVKQASVVDWLDVRVGQNVSWSLHVRGRREWGHDHTIAWEAEIKMLDEVFKYLQ